MPARADVVFDAFHYHHWRRHWDSLVRATRVQGGAPCPFVGAVTENAGAGMMRLLSMKTRFVSFDRPRVAAAAMVGRAFPFRRWAASMQHRANGPDRSWLIYTYTLEVGPPALRWLLEPPVAWVFGWQTRRRFARLRVFLEQHAADIEQWQSEGRASVAPDHITVTTGE
ncbi:MAG: hypothetical protein AB7G13_25985 [Lautropia sp.]